MLPEAQVVEASSQAYVAQMNDYKKKGELTADPNTIARVKQITNRLIAKATTIHPESKNWKWEVNVVNEPQVNAFAMAGGKIAVYTGLIEKINPTDDELAEVLAHEIGHALAGHTREKMSVSMGTELALAAYSTKAALDEKTQQALAAGALVAIQLPNSRHMESEADRLGIELAARAGYNPDAALSLWQKMGKLQSGSSPPEFLSTHPSDETRLHALSELVPQMKPIYLAAKQ
ncbi:MAG: M48 family metallopeptidase [Pseudomonadota bacterium]